MKYFFLTLVLLSLVGCFFTVKEMTIDPDKGSIHTEEIQDGIQKAQR